MIEQSTRNVPVSKPSSTSEDWLSMTCEQLSNGQVQVEYIPQLGNSKLPAPHFNISSAESSEDFAWERVIRKGPELSGRIRIRIHPSVPCDREFLKVCTLADRLVDVAEEEHQNHLQAERAAAEVSRDQLLDELETPDRLPDLVRNSLMKLLELTGYRGAAFFRLDENVSRLSLVEYQHKNLSEVPGPVRILGESNADDEALLQGSASHVREDSEDPWLPAEARTGFCVVIRISTGPIGTLWAYDRRLRRLDDRDYHVLQSIAGAMGRMIEQMLFRRQNSDNFRMSRELRLASMSQPSREIEFQSAGGEFEATGCCLSRYDVGGDLCELIPLDERFVLVAVGDASGNSLPAAMVMTSVRGGLYAMIPWVKSQLPLNTPLRELISNLNQMLVDLSSAHQFMSLFCGVIDLVEKKIVYCNAGHPPPILFHRGLQQNLNSCGLLLGIDESMAYVDNQAEYGSGDVLVLYTDGISESLNREHRLFRQDGIVASTSSCLQGTSRQIFQQLWRDLREHQGGNEEADDATALVIRFI